jgi:hypothetical protein
MLTVTRLSPHLLDVARGVMAERSWSTESVTHKLQEMVDEPHYLEGRNRRMATSWIDALRQS